jgi:hypothetical protein
VHGQVLDKRQGRKPRARVEALRDLWGFEGLSREVDGGDEHKGSCCREWVGRRRCLRAAAVLWVYGEARLRAH